MNAPLTLEESEVEIREFDDTADRVTGAGSSAPKLRPMTRSRRRRPWMTEAERQLRAIERLRVGWDSQGGAPPERETVRSAAKLLDWLASADADLSKPHIHPTRSGGVQFHWESSQRYFEIEILNPRNAQFYYVDKAAPYEIEGQLRVGDLVAEVLRLVRAVEQMR